MRNLQRILIMSALLAPPDEGGAEGGAGASDGTEGATPPPVKTFTQEEVDRIVAARVAKVSSAGKTAQTEQQKAAARVAELEAELEETRTKLLPAQGHEADLAKTARERDRLAKDLADAKARENALAGQVTELSTRQKNAAIESVVRDALSKSGAHAPGLTQAVRLMVAEGAAEVDDEGVTITIDRVPYTGEAAIAKAAVAWLNANPHFQKSTDGGSGGRRPNGGALPPADMDKMPVGALLRAGLKTTRPI
jgi:hypothetical protein